MRMPIEEIYRRAHLAEDGVETIDDMTPQEALRRAEFSTGHSSRLVSFLMAPGKCILFHPGGPKALFSASVTPTRDVCVFDAGEVAEAIRERMRQRQ